MATEADVNRAKEQWIVAAKMARAKKEHFKRRYEEEKKMGLVFGQTFEEWASTNAPAFIEAYHEFKAKGDQYMHVAYVYDREQAEVQKRELERRQQEAYSGAGEDKGSNYIIITIDDEE